MSAVDATTTERSRWWPRGRWREDVIPSPRHSAAVWRRNAGVFSKLWRGALLPTFLDPFFYLLALGFGLGTYVARINGIPYEDFIAPGLIASAAMWSSAFETTYNVYFRMNELRLYDNVLSTPVEVQDLVAGDLAWSATRSTLYGTVVLVVVAAFGLIGSWWAVLIPPFVALGGLCISVIGYTFTSLIPKIDLYSYFFTLGITPMFLFSGIFFPFDRLPDWAEVVAWFTPLYHLVEITRGMATGPNALSIFANAVWLAVVSGVLFLIPVRAVRRRLVA
jgi:lipooligosaccharide transport system permease protein